MGIMDRIRGRKKDNDQNLPFSEAGNPARIPDIGRQPMSSRNEAMRGRMAGTFAETMQRQAADPTAQGGMQQAADPQEEIVDRLVRGRTAEEQDAFTRGERIGAEQLLEMFGQKTGGAGETEDRGRIMNRQRLHEAMLTLSRYQAGKASVDARVVRAQQWWKLNNWEEMRKERGVEPHTSHPSNTGWLWNCIVGKHADAMDSFPEPVILARAQDDKEEANRLSKIVPVVMEMNDFEETYNNASWQKDQEGTGVYGVFWNSRKLNGLGDIDIKQANILNLYWEPGITDIQESRNLFYLSYEDKDVLEQQYPELQGQMQETSPITVHKYKTDDNVDLNGKVLVVDWYYHKWVGPRKILHYCKFVNEVCLYSSEEAGLKEGYYADGDYPFVLDALYPVQGSPAGYGYIDIARDTQSDIDTLSQAMLLNAVARSVPRYFGRKDGGINEKEFLDTTKPIVHVSGGLGQDSLMPIQVPAMGGDAHNMLAQKIDEIKFITGNTDVNNGGVPSGVTAASAIAALKEDSGRSSKDSTKASYRKIVLMVIERIRQFYDIPRQFRIIGQDGEENFEFYSNDHLKTQEIMNLPGQEPGLRMPVFDIEVRAQRENAYTKMSQNELALQFWGNGMLNPQMTDQALIAIDMMDFRGKEELRKKIQAQGTLQDVLQQVGQIAMALAAKYDQAAAMKLGAVLQSVAADTGIPVAGAQMMPGGQPMGNAPDDASDAIPDANENGIVRAARERAANASRPN